MIFFGLRFKVGVLNVLFRGFLRKGMLEFGCRVLRVMDEFDIYKN